jgi:hypothetical protein
MTARYYPCEPTDALYALASLESFAGVERARYDEQQRTLHYWLTGERTDVELTDVVVRRTLERVMSRHAVVTAPEGLRRA